MNNTNYRTVGPQVAVRGIRATIPSGYILGRSSAGPGPAELIPINGQGGLGTQLQNNGAVPTRLSQLTDVTITSLANQQRLRYSTVSGKWVNVDDTLSNLSDVDTTGISTGKLLEWNGTKWVPFTQNVDNLANVTITSILTGQALAWDGTKWTNQTISGGGGSTTLAGDTDVAITTPANNDFLRYVSGTGKWTNVAITLVTTFAGLSDVAVSTPVTNDVPVYDTGSSKWKNQPMNVEAIRVKPPAVATLTTRPGTGTIADTTYGFAITEVLTAANSNSLNYAVTPIVRGATNTFTFTVRLRKHFGSYNWVMPGVILRDSVGGGSLLMSNGSDSVLGFNLNRYTSDTTFSAVLGAFAWIGGPPLDWWMRIVDDNTNRFWYFSLNGSEWVQLYTEAKSITVSSANQVGVHLNPNAGGTGNGTVQGKNGMLECLSWQLVAS